MDKKNKKELLQIIGEQDKNLQKYKSRLHDIIESYKRLQNEKEILECSIKTLTDAEAPNETKQSAETCTEKSDASLQKLRSNLNALTAEKARTENELRADRKKLLHQKDELERNLSEKENTWYLEKEKYEKQIQELKRRVGVQQREREKEQHDHVLMLKELQNVLASERAVKEKLEEQLGDSQQKFNSRVSEKKIIEYEKSMEEMKNKLTVSQDQLRSSEQEVERNLSLVQAFQEEMGEMKSQYLLKIAEEKNRADMTEEKLKLHTFVKEKRISSLESRISELSRIVGEHDKLRQQDQLTIQKLKARISQLQVDCSTFTHISSEESNLWEYDRTHSNDSEIQGKDSNVTEKSHTHCQAEISRLNEELEQWKLKAESRLKERYQKTSSTLLSDAKAGKEIKELKSRITQLEDQLNTCKSQMKLNEEYHSKITLNLEKSSDDLKLKQKQDFVHLELSNRAQLMELEHQIQKQRERTLSLLEEKDKEIGQLKSTFLSSLIKKEKPPQHNEVVDETFGIQSDHEAAANLISTSLISSKNDGHILHYMQELSRKNVEISNLRHSRIQTESALRKLQQTSSLEEERCREEVEALKSRIKLLESSQDEKGTNVEYLKNVVLRFLKCNDPNSRRHMVNAIATVLHFTSSEVQDVKFM